jgi:hypothetical protein
MSEIEKLTTQEDLYRRKANSRRDLAMLPIEKKIETLIKLQELNSAIAKASGREYKLPWNINLPKSPSEK